MNILGIFPVAQVALLFVAIFFWQLSDIEVESVIVSESLLLFVVPLQ